MSDRAAPLSRQMRFGPFRLFPGRKLLLDGERPVRLGSRAAEILAALVERPGELLTKEQLIERVWPDTFVEEGSLRVHVAALRRALGDGQAGQRYIANIPGRGYSFVAPVTLDEEPATALPGAAERRPDLPVLLTRTVGRSETIAEIAEQLLTHRFVTVVGPGGIGKTTVAVAVAERLAGALRDGVRFVDLAPVRDPQLVPSALAALLGVAVRSDNPLPNLVAFLADKRLLIVLDSCEHVIEAAATLAEEIFNGTRGIHLLATSRETLRTKGERVHRLAPLAVPAEIAGLKAADALAFPSVQLFMERAAASLDGFVLGDAEAPLVAEICRRLDGIALAIEIVASRVDAFGVAGLAARLNDRLRLLSQGRRTALPRHRTLSATLDWSYVLLPESERQVLRRLSVFAGTFTLESANAVLAAAGTPATKADDAIADLVAKSLVSANVDAPIAFYRLLDTTRAYVLGKLDESDERERLSGLHAAHYRDLLQRSAAAWEREPATEWRDEHRHLIDNVRAALDWSFSASGDSGTGVALTVAAVPLWFALSLTSECAERVDRALTAPAGSRDGEGEMRLFAARAWSLMQTRGFVAETGAAWARVLVVSEGLGNIDYQLRAIWGLWADLLNRGELRPALAMAERFSALAVRRPTSTDRYVGDRMSGYILHLLGDQSEARRRIERMLAGYVPPVAGADMIRFVFDQRATAQCFLARILWLQGCADQANRLMETVVAGALAGDDVLSLCQTLVQGACPMAFFTGDLVAAERYVRLLLDHSERLGLEFWQAYGRCFNALLVIRQGTAAGGASLLRAGLEALRGIQFGVFYGVFLSELAGALGHAGRPADGIAVVDEALARAERNDERWYLPESLRIKGELVLRQGGADAEAGAEVWFRQSLDWSHRQQTTAWELRTTTSLAKLLHRQGRIDEAQKALAASLGSFAEGFASADLKAAKDLLETIA